MRIAIVEDNAAEAQSLARMTKACAPFVCKIDKEDIFSCGEDFLASKKSYDLVLIDCLLPGESGVELAREIRNTNAVTAFIFVTAYLEYAAEGYETEALRYLLKPVTEKKLAEALTFFAQRTQEDRTIEITGTNRRPVYVKSSQIMYIEAVKRGVVVRTENATVESVRSIAQFEAELGDVYFFRTQRQFLVGFRFVEKKTDDMLVMRGGERVKLSRRKNAAFNRAMTKYIRMSKQL